mmetsp:Transcript_133499/g.386441  ORF Transcript_133499/g.386441 Transcript_133499/m.386441 type:complete len:364 (+) Transcript_133499:1629-2720(+)
MSRRVPKSWFCKPSFAAHARTSAKAVRWARGMDESSLAWSWAICRSTSAFRRASCSLFCMSRRRSSAQASSCCVARSKRSPHCSRTSCSNCRRARCCRRTLSCAAFTARSSSRKRRCKSSRTRWLRSRRSSCLRISAANASLRSWMLRYCEPRPCFASNWSRCATTRCFSNTSSCRLLRSGAARMASMSRSAASIMTRNFSRSACACACASSAAFLRRLSSSSSNRARARSSRRELLARSPSSRRAVAASRCADNSWISTSARPSLARRSPALRCASLKRTATPRRSSSMPSMRSWAVRQSRSVSSNSKQRRSRSKRLYSTSSRCSSSRWPMRLRTEAMTSSAFDLRPRISSRIFSDSALRSS